KTLSALLAGRAMGRCADCRLVVLAPAGLHRHWQQEALAVGVQLELHSWARIPVALPEAGTVLIADEAHFAQSMAAARTRAFLRLARHPRLRAIWLLTGTPMKNGRPAQLFPLLAAIGHPLAVDQRRYEELFCQGHWREQGGVRVWQAQGASRLEELRRLTRPLLLHRAKRDCLDLPPKRRHRLAIDLDEASGQGFQSRLQRLIDDYRHRAAQGRVRRDAEALAVLTALRRLGSEYKLPAAARLLEQCLEAREPVVVFTGFVATAQLLAERLVRLRPGEGAPLLLTGRVPPPRRQALVERFQRGEAPLLIATYGTGGLGFTLHRARHVLLIERPWTPGDAEQAEDRCHRIGLREPLECHWLQLGVADQLVDGLIDSKAERIAVLLQGRERQLQRQALPEMVRRLIEGWS
ncbi:MAG: SNF2-related protein, partial [Prochlorococcaceae cyanobacterium]